ncbi:MAG: DUF4266 domain-containing protein [Sandaracinaceae bacterium]|nr:DUF4266 domain-containing protein [Sandaracinaceae bacterium]
MLVLRSSSKTRAGLSLLLSLALACGTLTGCVTVRPEDKEFLAEPSMIYGSEGATAGHEDHVLANREGSAGASGAAGGGCGCN